MRNTVVAWALLSFAWGAHAQQALELIPLRHATPEQVLPVLRPLVEPGGVLTVHSGQLLVRFDDRRLERESVQARGSMVSGRLGEWIELGSIGAAERSAERGIGVHSRREAYAGRRIRVKVEELAR